MQLPPKRRWLRFSIRTLLIAVTIFCVCLAWFMSEVAIVQRHRALENKMRSGGANVASGREYDFEWPSPPHLIRARDKAYRSSFLRRLMWDPADSVTLIIFFPNKLTPSERDEIMEAFPAAQVRAYLTHEEVEAPPPLPQES
jgi:hypothetical protein